MAGTATHRPFVHLTGQRAASEQPRSLNPWTAEPRAGTCPAGRCSGGRIRRIPRGAERSCPPSRSEPCHHPHCAAGWRRPAAERMRQAARLPGCAASRLHHGAMPLTERQRTAQLTARVRRLPAPPVLEDAVCASGKFDRAMWYSRSLPSSRWAINICTTFCPALAACGGMVTSRRPGQGPRLPCSVAPGWDAGREVSSRPVDHVVLGGAGLSFVVFVNFVVWDRACPVWWSDHHE